MATQFTAQAYTTPAKEATKVISTEDSLNGLLASDSKYIKQARQSGLETGAARGLLNSSISAGASEKSAIEAALPIAQQDAGYTQDLGRTEAQEAASSRLSYQDYTQQGSLANYNANTTSEQSKQDYTQNSALASESATAAAAAAAKLSESQASQITQKGLLDKEQETMTQTGANYRAQLTEEANKQVAQLNIASDEREQVSAVINSYALAYESDITGIMQNSNLTAEAKQKAMDTTKAIYYGNLKSLSAIYEVAIDMGIYDSPATSPATPTATTTEPATTTTTKPLPWNAKALAKYRSNNTEYTPIAQIRDGK